MGSLRRAMGLVALAMLATAGAAAYAPAHAEEAAENPNVYYPAAVDPSRGHGPEWERPKTTRFYAGRCGAGAKAPIDEVTINRDDVADASGAATYLDPTKPVGQDHGAGGWTLAGADLKVAGDGFELKGRWIGTVMTATVTRSDTHAETRCRFTVRALRSFTEFQ